ncbi:MAG: GNAT family N-acetyltransferase, partial [Gemmatimonadota bacterium]
PLRSDLRTMVDGAMNPVFRDPDQITYFTVLSGGTPVGRITAHIHAASNERYGRCSASFGFFDCADDPTAAGLLFDAACSWARRRGCDEIAGNFNLTAMQEMGVVVGGHERTPFLAQVHNPCWIPRLLGAHGFEPYFPMTSWSVEIDRIAPESLLGPRQRQAMESGDFTVEPIRRRGFRRAMDATWRLLNDSFDQNPLFVPLTREEFAFQADQMLWVLDSRIAYLLRRRGEPVGVIACLPDVNPLLRSTGSRLKWSTPLKYLRFRRQRTRASLVFGGVVPELQNHGLAAVLMHAAVTGMQRAGYRELGITWISDSNHPSLRQMEKLGATPHHRLNLFRKAL